MPVSKPRVSKSLKKGHSRTESPGEGFLKGRNCRALRSAPPAVPQQPSLPIPPLPEGGEYDTVEDAWTAANRFAKPYGFALIREKSARDGGRYMTCRRGDKDHRIQRKGSSGYCPYEAIVRRNRTTQKWRIVFANDASRTHSHGQFTPRLAHHIHRQDELRRKYHLVGGLLDAKLSYVQICARLKAMDNDSCVIPRDLPEFKQKWTAGQSLEPREKS
ncbi:hypothetical protein N7454_001553 [Penicillium verhagenii]|nr:hypothetical protein N7454_001553 [Penicillium verhagenii]